jgi:hypothetical protein
VKDHVVLRPNRNSNNNRSAVARARRAIRRYGRESKDISFLGKPFSNPSGGGGTDEETMEDHMNEVTDKTFVVVMRTYLYGRHDDCDPILASRPSPVPCKSTTRRPNRAI